MFPEAFNVYGNVYDKMNRLYELIIQQSTFHFDRHPELKQFLSGASWAIFTPSFNKNMEIEYDKCRDLCEKECKQLTEDKRNRYYTSPTFYIFLGKSRIQSLIESCLWLSNICSIISSKCLIQVAVMSEFVDRVGDERNVYVHRDLSFSSSLSANIIVFLDDDHTGRDGAIISSHLNCTQRNVNVEYLRSSVLYMSGKVYHTSLDSRAYGIRHAERNPSKGSPGYVHTQRRFLLINCCPYSELNMIDQILNSECYNNSTPYSLAQCVYTFENNIVSELSNHEVLTYTKSLNMVKNTYKK